MAAATPPSPRGRHGALASSDPVLASAVGRAVVLFAWLAFGWYLARR